MKRRFVLDENILHCAESGTNERGEEDLSSVRLVKEIARQCHATAVDSTIYQKYKQKALPRVLSLFSTMWRDEKKFIYCQDVRPINHEDKVPWKDVPFVRVAVQTQAILVTTDQPLIDSIAGSSIASEYGLSVFRPEEALPYALEH